MVFPMKKTLICFVFLALSINSIAQGTPDEKALLDFEQQLTLAIAEHKDDKLSNMFDVAYHGVTPNGKVVNKLEWLQQLKTNNPYVVFNTEEVKASVHGGVAVVTGKLVGKSKSGTIIGQSRFLHVLVKKENHWRIIEEQSTIVIEH
jgi:ketosteroid isomerase-like protein